MSKLMLIQASPRSERFYSLAVADAFVSSYKEVNPQDEVATLNVFKADLPAFDGLALQAKYKILHGLNHSPEELAAWKKVEEIIAEFKSADKYVMAVPMWNFGIPYRLKQYLDIIVQPTYTFRFGVSLTMPPDSSTHTALAWLPPCPLLCWIHARSTLTVQFLGLIQLLYLLLPNGLHIFKINP